MEETAEVVIREEEERERRRRERRRERRRTEGERERDRGGGGQGETEEEANCFRACFGLVNVPDGWTVSGISNFLSLRFRWMT